MYVSLSCMLTLGSLISKMPNLWRHSATFWHSSLASAEILSGFMFDESMKVLRSIIGISLNSSLTISLTSGAAVFSCLRISGAISICVLRNGN